MSERFAGSAVLVAEDNAISRAMLAHQLRALGCEPTCVNDGEAAAAAWRSGRFSLLLTDLQMPRLDGYGLAAAVRGGDRGRSAPIVALTATTSELETERCLAAGMNDCVTKPISLAALALLLDKWLTVVAATDTS